ncbi:LuxR C-terminal-related transcriptional regulator [Paenibacillus sp. 22594]|uniref:LuxR C-terminal-related transcriptional regulator n=1 Tax=Paenibacillus sp. 22594 TaxID=3453947 RepID=UPI003F870695
MITGNGTGWRKGCFLHLVCTATAPGYADHEPGRLTAKLPRKELLTDQETKVLLLIAVGLTNKQITSDLNITGEP